MKLLDRMINSVSPSGNEESINSVIKEETETFFDNVYEDDLGSLILHKKNSGKRIMIAASSDRPGILVTHVNRFGAVFFEKIGCISDEALFGSVVKFIGGARGVVCENKTLSSVSGDKKRKFFIDLISGSVCVGEAGILEPEVALCKDFIYGRCLGSIAGAYALAESIKNTENFGNCDIYVVFAAFGALHNRGVKAAGFRINPDLAFCVGACPATSKSIQSEYSCNSHAECGGGVAIKFKDRSVVTNKAVRDTLVSLATENDIDYQFSFTDEDDSMSGVLELSGGGIACGEICIPVKHREICADTMSVSDLNRCIQFLVLLMKSEL